MNLLKSMGVSFAGWATFGGVPEQFEALISGFKNRILQCTYDQFVSGGTFVSANSGPIFGYILHNVQHSVERFKMGAQACHMGTNTENEIRLRESLCRFGYADSIDV